MSQSELKNKDESTKAHLKNCLHLYDAPKDIDLYNCFIEVINQFSTMTDQLPRKEKNESGKPTDQKNSGL